MTDRIVLVDSRFTTHLNGGSRYRFELITRLGDLLPVQLAAVTLSRDTALLDSRLAHSVRVVAHSPDAGIHPGTDVFEHLSLPKLARKLEVDLYHGTFQVLPMVRAAARQIVTIHDLGVFNYPDGYGQRFARYMRFLIRMSVRNASHVITVSEATRRELLREFPEADNRSSTILNGVSPNFAEARALNHGQITSMLHRLNIRTPYILFVGNLEPKKNLPRLLEAFRMLRERGMQHTLVIAGKPIASGPGSGIDTTPELLQTPVHFTGYVADDDLPALYRGADVLAYPSLYEGFGMPVLEGMAAGVPIVTSNVSSLPEVSGGVALEVDPLDSAAIAGALFRAISDMEWRRIATGRGVERANLLSWERTARLTAELYARLLNKRGVDARRA